MGSKIVKLNNRRIQSPTKIKSPLRSILLLLLLVLSLVPTAYSELEHDANDSWTLVNDGYGFENAVRQEYPRFHDFEEQEKYFHDYNYPELFTYNETLNIGRDAENQMLWFSFRPRLQYGNRQTWPSTITNQSLWPTSIEDGLVFPEDQENLGYYISKSFEISFFILIHNAYFTHFQFYTNQNICPDTNWKNQWQPCNSDLKKEVQDSSFPLVIDQNKTINQLTEGFDQSSAVGIPPLFNLGNTHSYDDIQIDEDRFCGFFENCNDDSYCCSNDDNGPKMRSGSINLLVSSDYDNFGFGYKIEKHPATVAILIPGSPAKSAAMNGRLDVPDIFLTERENASIFRSPEAPYNSPFPVTGSVFIGSKGMTLLDVSRQSAIKSTQVFDLTEDKLIDPVIVDDPYVPEVNIYPPQSSYRPSITLALITTTAASTVALSASVVFLNRKMAENINRNPVKRRDQKRRSKIIRSALSKNIIRRD